MRVKHRVLHPTPDRQKVHKRGTLVAVIFQKASQLQTPGCRSDRLKPADRIGHRFSGLRTNLNRVNIRTQFSPAYGNRPEDRKETSGCGSNASLDAQAVVLFVGQGKASSLPLHSMLHRVYRVRNPQYSEVNPLPPYAKYPMALTWSRWLTAHRQQPGSGRGVVSLLSCRWRCTGAIPTNAGSLSVIRVPFLCSFGSARLSIRLDFSRSICLIWPSRSIITTFRPATSPHPNIVKIPDRVVGDEVIIRRHYETEPAHQRISCPDTALHARVGHSLRPGHQHKGIDFKANNHS